MKQDESREFEATGKRTRAITSAPIIAMVVDSSGMVIYFSSQIDFENLIPSHAKLFAVLRSIDCVESESFARRTETRSLSQKVGYGV
jgi:hypothetical protein